MTQTINPGGDEEGEGWQIAINGEEVDEVTILQNNGHRHTVMGPFTHEDVQHIHTAANVVGLDNIADPEGNLAHRIDFQPPSEQRSAEYTKARPFI